MHPPDTQSPLGVGEDEDEGGKREESQFEFSLPTGVPSVMKSIFDMYRRCDIDSLSSKTPKAVRSFSDLGSFEAPLVVMRPSPTCRVCNPGGNIAHISSSM